MKKTFISSLLLLLTSCSSMKDVGKVGFGGLVGWATSEVTDDDTAGIVAGAAAYGAAEYVDHKTTEDESKAKLEGYEAGQADMAKHMYWTIQDMQKGNSTGSATPIYSEYTFDAPTEKDGVKLLPRPVTLRVIEGYKK